MLFSKEPNVSYTDMCIFFDKNFFSDERDDEKCFKYLYLIFHMLAFKKRYFKNYSDYDEFAEYAAITVYTRFIKKWENSGKNKSVHKSILNYAKSSLYYLKVGFQREYYREVLDPNKIDVDTNLLHEKLRDSIQQSYNFDIEESTLDVFRNISSMIWDVVNTLPYRNDKIISRRIYLSVYFTLINEVTFSNNNERKINKKLDSNDSISSSVLTKILRQERLRSVVIWRLPNSMQDYIKVLTNRVRIKLQDELKRTRDYYRLPDDVLDSILNTAWEQSINKSSSMEEEI